MDADGKPVAMVGTTDVDDMTVGDVVSRELLMAYGVEMKEEGDQEMWITSDGRKFVSVSQGKKFKRIK